MSVTWANKRVPGRAAGSHRASPQWQPRRHRPEARPVRLDEFITQVSRHTRLAEARAGTAAVLPALRQGLSEDRYRDLIGQLPAEYAGLARAAG
jgi:uncharacterized protein (DUF2267 family)